MGKKIVHGIDVSKLDQEILDLGVRVKVFKSTLCPNITSLESDDHDVNCKLCNNRMHDFAPEVTTALFQQQVMVDQFRVAGTFHVDEIMVSFLSGVTLHTFTRVDLLDFTEDFFELIQRQVGTNTDTLKYRACEVLGLFTAENDAITEYHYGTDFKIDINGSIEWVSAHKPDDRRIYSIYYKYAPIYRAIKAVHRDRYSQFNIRTDRITSPKVTLDGKTYVKLPETWVLKRDYLVERKSRLGTNLPQNTFYDPNEP